MDSKKNVISSILLIIIIGALSIFLLVNFKIIDNPLYLLKGNEIKEIHLTVNSLEMRKGEVTHLEITNENSDVIEYISNDSNIVTVNEVTGYVKAVGYGTTDIVAKLKNHNEISDTCTITVLKPISGVQVSSIDFTTPSISLNVGSSKTLYYKITPSNAENKIITWSTSDSKIATIDKYGLVKGISEGTAIIKVKTGNGKEASCEVTVTKKSSSQTPSSPSTPTPTPTPVPTPTPTPQPTADSICESVKNNSSIDYKSFKELSKQNSNDDYYAIKAAHDCANKYHKPVVVSKDTYHIYKYNKDKGTDRIVISTDTNFGSSTFYIHDEKDVCESGKLKYDDYIFDVKDTSITYTISKPQNIKKGGTISIPSNVKTEIANTLRAYNETVSGYHIDITDQNENRKIFIRSGSNESDSNQSLVQESFKVDANGKILSDISWTYNNSAKVNVVIKPISSRKMTVQNGIFKNVVSSSRCKSGYVKRGMKISRSNINIANIKHMYVTKDNKQTYKIKYAYHGFFAFSSLSNVTFQNSTVQGMRNDSKSDTKLKNEGYSTYDLHIGHTNNITLNNITMADKEIDTLIKKKDNMIWGVTGTNFVKDITYNNCKLNRIDTHRGVYNLTVNNSIIGIYGLTQTGFGKLTLNNVTIKHANRFIKLRDDYGSRWQGDIIVTGNNTIIPDNNDKVYLITFNAEKGHNYGYDLYLPNVNLKGNLTIKSDTSAFSIFNKSESYFASFNVGGGYKLKNFKTGEKPSIKTPGTVKSNKGTLGKPHYHNS